MNHIDLYNQLKKFPKIDLHRHLEGSILPETFIEIAGTYGGSLPANTLESLRPLIQMVNEPPGFHNFLNKFTVFRCFYPCREAIEDIAYRAVRDAADDGVKYLELRYSPTHFACGGRFSEWDVVHWIQSAIDRASRDCAVIVTPIATISRDYGVALAEQTVNMIASLPPGFFYGLDLAGDETTNSAHPYASVFRTARELGLKLSIHAGEAGGAENVYQAVEQYRAARIGHGIRAADDEALMRLLQEKDILLELCLTSNLQTAVVSSIQRHPITRLMEFGVPVSLNTDDPAISGITLTHEYVMAIQELALTIDDMKLLNKTALEHAFYPDIAYLKKQLLPCWE